MMRNNWIAMNTHPLVQIKKFLTECEYKPEFDDFPLRPIQKLLNGAEAEINKLQNEVETLRNQVKKLKQENKSLSDTASDKVQSPSVDKNE